MALAGVVLPTYNRGHLLPEALGSIAAQTFRDFRVAIADDGSTDDTKTRVAQVCAEHPALDGRVEYLLLPHGGVAAARNVAIRALRGVKYIAFLDSDDLWRPHHLARAVALLEQEPDVAVVFARVETAALTGGWWTPERVAIREERMRAPLRFEARRLDDVVILDSHAVPHALLQDVFSLPTSTVVVRASVVGTCDWFDPSLAVHEDSEFYLRLAMAGQGFAFFDAAHCATRHLGDNLTGDASLDRLVTLARMTSVLAYCQRKLGMCVAKADRRSVLRELADQAYLVGQCLAEQRQWGAARRHYVRSLGYKPARLALRALGRSLVPDRVLARMRRASAGDARPGAV
jgi:glycosyltransferase involved in cell wall biosynthesis